MVFGAWRRDEPLISTHEALLAVAFVTILIGAYFIHGGITKSAWPIVEARVMTVEVRCNMSAMGVRRSSTVRSVLIDCDQVEQFRRDNASRNWSMTKVYRGTVRVPGNGETVTLVLPLSPHTVGKVPEVGDRFDLLQNPESSTDVAFVDSDLTDFMLGACAAGFGGFMLLLAFFWF